ncbi:MAG TPA: hypothetical protein VIS96_00675 [Terrimicrobiaceae bacterium]
MSWKPKWAGLLLQAGDEGCAVALFDPKLSDCGHQARQFQPPPFAAAHGWLFVVCYYVLPT